MNFVWIPMSALRESPSKTTHRSSMSRVTGELVSKLMASTTYESWGAWKHQVVAVVTKPLISRITILVPYLLFTGPAASTLTLKIGIEGRDFTHLVTDTNTHTTSKFSSLRQLGLDFVGCDDWSIRCEFFL